VHAADRLCIAVMKELFDIKNFGSSPNRVGKKAGLMVRKEALDEG
jgi:hypothetical protein